MGTGQVVRVQVARPASDKEEIILKRGLRSVGKLPVAYFRISDLSLTGIIEGSDGDRSSIEGSKWRRASDQGSMGDGANIEGPGGAPRFG
jgi:hypothetical protein